MVNIWKYININLFIGLLIIYQLGGYYFDINTNFIDYIKNNKNKTVIEKVIISKNNNPEILVLIKKIIKSTNEYNKLPNTIYQKQLNIINKKIYPIHSSIEISGNHIKKNGEKKILAIFSEYKKLQSRYIDFIINYYKDYVDQIYLFIPFKNWKSWVPTKNIEIKLFDIKNSYVDFNLFHKTIITNDNININISNIRNLKFTVPSYISFTTIPSRLKHPWMFNNIKNRLKIIDDSQMILNVPDKSKKYQHEIPMNIKNLTSKKFY